MGIGLEKALNRLDDVESMLGKVAAVSLPGSLKEAKVSGMLLALDMLPEVAEAAYSDDQRKKDSQRLIALSTAVAILELAERTAVNELVVKGDDAFLALSASLFGWLESVVQVVAISFKIARSGVWKIDGLVEFVLNNMLAFMSAKKLSESVQRALRFRDGVCDYSRAVAFPQLTATRVRRRKKAR